MNLFRKLIGSPFLPSPYDIGFYIANILHSLWTLMIFPNSGMNISFLWSNIEFNPSNTFWGAKLRFFKSSQWPSLIAYNNGPSTNLN